MLARVLLTCALLAPPIFAPTSSVGATGSATHRLGLILHDRVPLYSTSSVTAPVLARLVKQTQVEVVGRGRSWAHVQVWATVQGWVRSKELVFRRQWETISTYRSPPSQRVVHARGPYAIHSAAVALTAIQLVRWPRRIVQSTIPPRSSITVSGWRQDKHGNVWFRVGDLWTPGVGVRFQASDPGLATTGGHRLYDTVRGKGMWLTLGVAGGDAPDPLVTAARRNGITHLYVEAAISPLGFHGAGSVGSLIDSAHRNHIRVIAWVFPFLDDVAGDVSLTRRVANFRSLSGERFDGIAEDVEHQFGLSKVRSYTQLTRSYLGPHYLLVGVTYPPQSFPAYPFAEIARNCNVVAPMDYWHQTNTSRGLDYGHLSYGYDYGYRYAADSIRTIRRVSGHVPVAPIGQTFDNFGVREMGPHAPSRSEVDGFLHGARASGAIGSSFFEWMTATVDEWHAIHDFRF